MDLVLGRLGSVVGDRTTESVSGVGTDVLGVCRKAGNIQGLALVADQVENRKGLFAHAFAFAFAFVIEVT